MEDYKKLEESMENYKSLIWWLRWMGTQTGKATYTRVADAFENIITENAALRRQVDNLTDAQAVMVKEFTEKLEELHETKSELDRLKTERDAAVALLRKTNWCSGCVHFMGLGGYADDAMSVCGKDNDHYQFRGPQKEA